MKAEDARHLYVDVAEPLAERAALSLTARARMTRRPRPSAPPAPRAPPARSKRPSRSWRNWSAPATHGRRLRLDGGGGARPLRARPARGADPRRRPPQPRAGPLLRRGAPARGLRRPELKLAVYPFRRLVHRRRRAEETPPPSSAAAVASPSPSPASATSSSMRTTASPLRRLRYPGDRRRHPRLPLPRIKGEDRVDVPTEQLEKLSCYLGAGGEPILRRSGGKRWQNLKARAANRRAPCGRLVNLTRAPPAKATPSRPTASGRSSSSRISLTARTPTRSR